MNEEIIEGIRVVVPFGKNKLYLGVVLSIGETPPNSYEAKYILSVLDNVPLLKSTHLAFWRWLSVYYMCYPGEVMQAALPAGLKMQSETKIILNPEINAEDFDLDDREAIIIRQLRKDQELSPERISKLLDLKNCYKYIKSLHDRNLILFIEELEDSYRPLYSKIIALAPAYQDDTILLEIFNTLEKKAPAQMAVLARFISAKGLYGNIKKEDLLKFGGVTESGLKALVKKEILLEAKSERGRLEMSRGFDSVKIDLAPFQQKAYESIVNDFADKTVVLLQGVTSSGKTHIYFKLIEDTLAKGKQVLYLVPEIALTTQLIDRVKQQFGNRAVVSHSRFNSNERVEIWNAVANSNADVILGPRSAVFMPFVNLGLVIVDEEHENSYKQYEPAPRYNGRDAAIMLASFFKAKTLLGTATPSLESYHNVLSRKYGYAQLSERFGGIKLPEIEVVDMKEEKRKKLLKGLFSKTMLNEIQETLKGGEQVILFLNRKGYVPVTTCGDCSWSPTCVNCDITLTYYKSSNRLRCHYCGYTREPVERCPACGSTHLLMEGYGTERLEDEVKMFLPEVPVGRMDYDTTRTKTGHQRIISDYKQGVVKILIGTQMVAKGLDFDNVRLVGIMHADQMISFPDFRAAERAFQLMVQVAGRAGRRDKPGKVIIQTYKPDHPVIHQVLAHDFKEFYGSEIAERHKFNYPPFSRLIKLTLRHKDYNLLQKASEHLYSKLRLVLGSGVLGPQTPSVGRIRNYYLKDMLIKIDNEAKGISNTKNWIRQQIMIFNEIKDYKSVYVHADVDPY